MADAGQRVDAIDNKPKLHTENYDIYRAFWTLSRSRQSGFNLGAIPLSEIKAYIQIFEIDFEDRERFVFLIGETDDEYLEWQKLRSSK